MQTSTCSSTNIRGISVNIDDASTALYNIIGNRQEPKCIYAMQGRRVSSMREGQIYIIDGKRLRNETSFTIFHCITDLAGGNRYLGLWGLSLEHTANALQRTIA